MSQDSVEDLLNEEDDVEDDYNIDNDQEEKLLQDDSTDLGENDASENELDESEDVLNLEAEDELDEEDAEGRRTSKSKEHYKTDKFTNERPPISPIQFSKDEIDKKFDRNNKTRPFQNPNNFQQNRGRGRFNKQQKWKMGNKTVHINPHFKGDVQINGGARLKWDSGKNQRPPIHQGRGYNNFKQPPRVVWQNQQQHSVPDRFNPPPYMGPPGGIHDDVQIVQHYAQPQMPQMVNPAPVPQMQYTPPPNQFFQNREVFAQQAPMAVGFYQPPPQTPQLMPQHCYQPPQNYCNNPVFNPVPYNTAPPCLPYNSNQPVVYNTPPPPQGDFCQPYPMQPPVNNYCGSFENNMNNSSFVGNFARSVQPANAPDCGQNQKIVKTVYTGKQQKKRFTNKNFDSSGLNKKKRAVESSTLHEIKPVETPKETVKAKDTSTVKLDNLPEGLDEEYMRKIEEQKRLREEIFKRKELKRMQMAASATAEDDVPSNPIKKIVAKPTSNFVKRQNMINNLKSRNQNRNLVQISQQPLDEPPNIQIEVAAQNTSRVIQLKKEEEDVGLTKGFLSNRTMLTNDQSLLNTPVVVVKNLSAGTTENKLQKMCQGIGEVQTLHLSREERQATIHFKSVASAHAFYKKYQRHMLDLSMIQVHLQTV